MDAVLLWLLTAACIKTGRPQIARRAIELAETRLIKDNWPEYYDGKLGRFIGKQARKSQTWSIAGYLVAKMMLEDPSHLGTVALEEDKQMKPPIRRSNSWTFWCNLSSFSTHTPRSFSDVNLVFVASCLQFKFLFWFFQNLDPALCHYLAPKSSTPHPEIISLSHIV